MKRKGTALLAAVIGLWVAAGAVFLFTAARYRAAPGTSADAPGHWPDDAPIARVPGRVSVVMLAHPRCPCTRASLIELTRLMTEVGSRVDAHIFFVRPSGLTQEWAQTDTWDSANRIPGAHVHLDPEGREARRFGAETSGQVVAFAPDGRLIFSGGITGGRGHAGDNAGHDALRALVLGERVEVAEGPVYGCPLHDGAATREKRP